MKRMFWIIIGLLIAAGLLLTGCNQHGVPTPDTDVEDGSVRDETNPDAPKVIESTQIIAFRCDFSCDAMDREETRLSGQTYQLEAKLENGAVKGSYYAYSSSGGEKTPFRASHSFMSALQKVTAEHDLAQHNGLSYQVSGLPEDCGAYLSVTYASGESIHAIDNQNCFLAVDATEALEALFYAQIEPHPLPLDLSIAEEFTIENADGRFLSLRYPVLTLGYPHWDGTYRNGQGHDALDAALDAYNREIRMNQEAMLQYTLRPAAASLTGDAPAELCSLADISVTRCDSRVVSFYETVTQDTGLIPLQQFRRTFNFDTRSGKKLNFTDVFTDVNGLPDLLADLFTAAASDLSSADDLAEKIHRSIREEDGLVCYALAADGVHFFAEKNPLGGVPGTVHTMVSYQDYPELVKDFYRPAAERWLTSLEYDMDYVLPGGSPLRISWELPTGESENILWTISINGKNRTEEFYSHEPECWLVQTNHKFFLYLEEPASDVSHHTRIYEITASGLISCGEVAAAMHNELSCNPEHLLMVSNDYVSSGGILLMSYGLYCIGEDGLPRLIQEEYGLVSPPLSLTQAVEATMADQNDPAFEDGPLPLDEGTLLQPFRTDRKSYLDFFDEAGNVCRFSIDGFSDEMRLNHFGTLEELLESVHEIR